jgi:hypothetical protein
MTVSDDFNHPHRAVVHLPGGDLTHRSVFDRMPPVGKIVVSGNGAGTFYIDCESKKDAAEYETLAYLGLFSN